MAITSSTTLTILANYNLLSSPFVTKNYDLKLGHSALYTHQIPKLWAASLLDVFAGLFSCIVATYFMSKLMLSLRMKIWLTLMFFLIVVYVANLPIPLESDIDADYHGQARPLHYISYEAHRLRC